jgi:hypothetical protein
MPKSQPDAAVLLAGLAKYLEDELMPTLDGYHRFKTRVAINVVNLVRRELELGPAQARAEAARLAALLGHDGDLPSFNRELIARIHDGAIGLEDKALRDHLRRSVAEALAINNPKWLKG